MAAREVKGKKAIGIFLDGYELKYAQLVNTGKSVVLTEFKSVPLAHSVAAAAVHETAGIGDSGGLDFGAPTSSGYSPISDLESNAQALAGVLAKEKNYILGHAFGEPAFYFHFFETDFGLKGEKLQKRILQELKNTRGSSLPADAVGIMPLSEGGVLCAVREDASMLIQMFEAGLGKRHHLPRFGTFEPSDFALVNFVKANYSFGADEISVVVYIGTEASRIVFFRGNNIWHIAPLISEGSDSGSILNTVYSRVLLEQDNLAIPGIKRILLAGEAPKLGATDFFLRQFREVEIEYLIPKRLDLSHFPPDSIPAMAEFAVPIASAWRALVPDQRGFTSIDLLPNEIREGQKVLKIGLPGYALLLLIFALTLFLTVQITSKSRDLKRQKSALIEKQSQLTETTRIQAQIDSLMGLKSKYQSAQALYDTLVPGSNRWSKAVSHLTHGVQDVGMLWVEDLKSTGKGGMNLNGIAEFRGRVPRIANLFEGAVLRQAVVQKIREQIVYRYQIEIDTLSNR